MSLFRRRPAQPPTESRYGLDDWAAALSYPSSMIAPHQSFTAWGKGEGVGNSFEQYATQLYQRNGIVFACICVRQLVFSEARFQYRRYEKGRPGELFGDGSLQVLERPWPGGTTGELLARMEQDASLAGNCYLTLRDGRIRRLRPDWVTIVVGSEHDADATDLDATVLGYLYHPNGNRDAQALLLETDEVAHYSPIPDPTASYRGMSWLTPILAEVRADHAATDHKWKFFENGATPNFVIKTDQQLSQESAAHLKEQFDHRFKGVSNAYKTMILSGGLSAQVVGSSFEQISFKTTQGAGETRIAAAAGVPPVIVGLSEGLEAATYSNYAQARRRFADGTIRPLWRMAASCLERLVTPPDGAHLWFDDTDIAFLREDNRDAAEIQAVHSSSIKSLVDAGFDADSVVEAVTAGDLRRLRGGHSGLYSVQLQPPRRDGTPALPPAPPPTIPPVVA